MKLHSVKWDLVFSGVQAACALLAVAVGVWGIFVSDVGERLAAQLRGDVAKAEEQAAAARRQNEFLSQQRAQLQSDVADRQQILEQVGRNLVESRFAAERLRGDSERLSREVEQSMLQLKGANQDLAKIQRRYGLTLEAQKYQVCDRLVWAMTPLYLPDFDDRIVPQYLFEKFAHENNLNDFSTWGALIKAFDEWAKSQYADEQGSNKWLVRKYFLLRAGMEEGEYRSSDDYIRFKRQFGERYDPPLPREFSPDLFTDVAREPGSIGAMPAFNPYERSISIFAKDPLLSLDDEYARWLAPLQEVFEQERSNIDFNFPIRWPINQAYDDTVRDMAARYIRYRQAAARIDRVRGRLCTKE